MDTLTAKALLLPDAHQMLVGLSLIWFTITLPSFVMAASMSPGYLEK